MDIYEIIDDTCCNKSEAQRFSDTDFVESEVFFAARCEIFGD